MPAFRSIRSQILALVFGTLVAMGLGVVTSVNLMADAQIEKALRQDLRNAKNVLASVISAEGEHLTQQVHLVAELPSIKSVVAKKDHAAIDAAVDDYRPKMGVSALIVIDGFGHVLGESGADLPLGLVAEFKGIQPWKNGQQHIGLALLKGKPYVTATTAIKGQSGKVLAYLTAANALEEELAQTISRSVGTELVFVRDDHVVASSMGGVNAVLMRPDEQNRVTVNGVAHLGMFDSFPQSEDLPGVGFIALKPVDQARAPYQRFVLLLTMSILVATLVSIVVAIIFARYLTTPLKGILDAARALRLGEWPQPFNSSRSDEFGLLERTFDEMSESLRESRQRLIEMVRLDPLTELANHRTFQEKLELECHRADETGARVSVMMIDIDRFGAYNRVHGREAGDRLLVEVARLLQQSLPQKALVSRYQSDVFGVVLPEVSAVNGCVLAKEVLDRVGTKSGTSLSIGVAEFGTDASRPELLILAAELATSRAKQLGRSRWVRFQASENGGDTPLELQQFLANGSYATIRALAEAVDAKDPYTNGHSHRVATYAAALAREIGSEEEFVELVFMTGTLHDVGKIGVPDSILKKATALDGDERAIMEQHPVFGEKIVSQVPTLAETVPGVRHHHERWDGRGYPDRLKGFTIPLMARILALADTWDAMTSDRPYRKGLQWDVARAEIEKGAGTQFDPTLVEPFLRSLPAQRPSESPGQAAA
ncbi:MAG: diguanylate cyclase [Fimbriimonadaceae bacterium]|nr:diguanylate cyclase [Fimbriimonadaceae bacterium]QYK55734.1 MAG: diguanylate cyclase [Fimbriimonadaceae bacterium]